MRGSWLVVAWAVVAGCARTHVRSVDANRRCVRVVELAEAWVPSPGAPYTAGRTSLTVSGATLVAEWGDDRGRLADAARRGPALSGHRAIFWSHTSMWIVDTATEQPLQGFRWPAAMTGRGAPEHLVVDPSERWVAAEDASGVVTLGPIDGSAFAALPQDPQASARSPRRLHVSPDGARLAGRAGVWEVSSRRALVALRSDQALLTVDPSVARAVVTTVTARETTEGPGRGCGLVRTAREEVVTSAAMHDLTAGTSSPLPLGAVSETVTSLRPPVLAANEFVAGHPVRDVDLGAHDDLAVVDDDGAWRIDAREARRVALAPPTRRVSALRFTDDGLMARAAIDGAVRTIVATVSLGGGAGRALVDGIQSMPNRAGVVVVRDDDRAWSLWDLRRVTRVRALPDPGRLGLEALDQAMVGDDGSVVLRDEAPGQHAFLVGDGAGWRRVSVAAAQPMIAQWALRRDARHVAYVDGQRVNVVDLRDGRVWLRAEADGGCDALAMGDGRVAIGDGRGRVRVLDLDGVERARIDLSGRFDRATALAFRPDGGALAVGTARGRVFVFRWVP